MELADLTGRELWLRYVALGGTASPGSVATHLQTGSMLDPEQHNIIVRALNDRFGEMRLGRPVPYAGEPL